MGTNRARRPGRNGRGDGRPARGTPQPGRAAAAGRGGPRGGPRSLPAGRTLLTPDASPLRQAVERRSAATALWLHQVPAWLLPVVLVALLVTGLAVAGPVGAAALCGVALVLGWLAVLSWPRLSPQSRLLRIAAVCVAVGLAVLRAVR